MRPPRAPRAGSHSLRARALSRVSRPPRARVLPPAHTPTRPPRYGETEEGDAYWTIKNSWSEFWGEDGYMRISRRPVGLCGIGAEAYFPVL